jgi:hypothetical protein
MLLRNWSTHLVYSLFLPVGKGRMAKMSRAAERAWREALRFTSARANREFLRRRLAVCRPDGGENSSWTGP